MSVQTLYTFHYDGEAIAVLADTQEQAFEEAAQVLGDDLLWGEHSLEPHVYYGAEDLLMMVQRANAWMN